MFECFDFIPEICFWWPKMCRLIREYWELRIWNIPLDYYPIFAVVRRIGWWWNLFSLCFCLLTSFQDLHKPDLLDGSNLMVESIGFDKNCEFFFLNQVKMLHSLSLSCFSQKALEFTYSFLSYFVITRRNILRSNGHSGEKIKIQWSIQMFRWVG